MKTEYWIDNKQFFNYKNITYVGLNLFRENGPSYIKYHEDEVLYEIYIIGKKWHRTDGPAWINYNSTAVGRRETYYLDDIEIEDAFVEFCKKYNLLKHPKHCSLDIRMIFQIKFWDFI